MSDETEPPDREGLLKISTDGSSFRNGEADAAAGVGVFFGVSDPRNVGAPLGPVPQSNQRAELMTVKIALEKVALNQDVLIRSDSDYAMKCVTDWHRRWSITGWNKPAGRELHDNLDLIRPIVDRCARRKFLGTTTEFFWIAGHTGDPGNEAADKLASRGSKQAWFQRPENRNKKTFQNDGVPRGYKVVRRPDGSGEDLVRLTPEISESQSSARPSREAVQGKSSNDRVANSGVKKKKKKKKKNSKGKAPAA